ncbi:MAG: copper-translocating P-type ATPase [Puniceicoccaceae bacterium]|nr:MAG: copper-translocating P-type ATPase [Puniceicoccaceae bacterium]
MGLPKAERLMPRLYVALACTVPLLILSMGPMVPGVGPVLDEAVPFSVNAWLQLLLATPVFFWAGGFFIRRFLVALRRLDFNMFTLVVIGTGAAYGYSVVATLAPGVFPEAFLVMGYPPLYFEATAVIITLVLLGQIIEQRAYARTGEAVRALMELRPARATRVDAEGNEAEVAIEDIAVGDRLRVRPGEAVPVDGELVEGRSALDEALLTGEPVPVEKGAGDAVIGGSLNTTGGFIMRATRVGGETFLAQVIRLVEQAQASRPPVQRLVDRVTNVFVPVVLSVAVIAFVVWMAVGPEPRLAFALLAGVAVLIIACPCALGLATPVSIVTGVGRGAREGILVKDAGMLERLRSATVVLFDKTGTLTEGRLRVRRIHADSGLEETQVLALAAAVERGSEHPLGRSLVVAAEERGVAIPRAEDFASTTGGGVSATVEGRSLRCGREGFVFEGGAEAAGREWKDRAEAWRKEGMTAIFLAEGGRVLAAFGLEDPLKEGSAEAVRELRALGLRVGMVTGDAPATAAAIAARAGIEPGEVTAGVPPEKKQALVQRLREEGERVAFVGDGINDAPALAAADVGVALGTGTDVALESAGLVLVRGDPRLLVRAWKLSRAVLANIRQNLFFAFVYNSLGIPIAAGVLYPLLGWMLNPMVAAFAMTLSSLSVVSNALRLRIKRI